MSAADKTIFDTRTVSPTAGSLAQRNSAGRIQGAVPGTDTAAYTPKSYVDAADGLKADKPPYVVTTPTTKVPGRISADLTVTVPTNYATIQAAINDLASVAVDNNARIIIRLAAGQKYSSTVLVSNGDYSMFSIQSVDAVVQVDTVAWVAGTPLIKGDNANMPEWAIMVDCLTANVGGDLAAITVQNASTLKILPGCGAKNGAAGCSGLIALGASKVFAAQCVFTGFKVNNIWITHSSRGYIERAVATGAGKNGLFASRVSQVYAVGANFSGAAECGILARRSFVAAFPFGGSTQYISNCGSFAIASYQGSTVIAHSRDGDIVKLEDNAQAVEADELGSIDISGAEINRTTYDGIRALGNGRVAASLLKYTSIGRNLVKADNAAIVNINGATGTGLGADALTATNLAQIEASSATLLAAVGRGAVAATGAKINVSSANLSGATIGGLRAVTGGQIIAFNTNARSGATDAITDVQITQGGLVFFNGGTGGVSTTTNVTGASGTIYR
jgi:hypothetical protein